MRRHRDDIIWVGVTAFGVDGPYAGRPGIDFLIQGYAGLLALNGEPEGPPVRVTVPLIDTLTSVLASTAALAAIHTRAATGQGQRIDISLLDALIHAQAAGVGSYLITGEETPRTGNRSLYFAPSGIYGTKDGRKVVITCPSQRFFNKLCDALDVDWDQRPALRECRHPGRVTRTSSIELLEARCNDFGRDELMERLIAADVLTAPVNSVREVPEDPQIRHNRMIVTTEHEKLGPVTVTGVPIHLQGTPGSVRRASPLQGQHTEEILAEIGYGPETDRRAREPTAPPPPAPSLQRARATNRREWLGERCQSRVRRRRRAHAPAPLVPSPVRSTASGHLCFRAPPPSHPARSTAESGRVIR